MYDDVPFFLNEFLNYMYTIKGKSKNTIQVYYYDIRIFLKYLKQHFNLISKQIEFDKIEIKDLEISIIKKVSLSDLYDYMGFISNTRSNSSYSRARKVASLRSFYKYICEKRKYIDYNPTKELESPKINKTLPKYLDLDESKNLLNNIDGEFSIRDYAIITLFLNCGLRLSELVNINLDNFKNNSLNIVGKGGKERFIPLNESCISAIEDYLKVRPANSSKALFISKRKKRISKNTVQYLTKKHITNAGLDNTKYSTHKLRHTAATLMYNHGSVDIRSLQEILGHESISTTEIYTHLDKNKLLKALKDNPLNNFKQSK